MAKLLTAIVCFMMGVTLMNNCITAMTKGIKEGIFVNLKVSFCRKRIFNYIINLYFK